DRKTLLDSVSIYHRMEEQSKQWVEQHGWSVIELHSYAVPDTLQDPQQVRAHLLEEFIHYFPECQGMQIQHEYMQFRRDFPSFQTQLHAHRPTVQTEIPSLCLAGDWVKLPCPAMLMEAAHTSGMLATNHFLQQHNLQTYPIYSVPLRGLTAKRRQSKQLEYAS
ncbi:MAG: amine oxidase, partial [Myxococcota bacterium]